MIKREHIYLGIKNNQGVITPLVGMHDQDKIRNLVNGELLNTTGTVYGAIEGFPSCSLDQILAAWKFKKELTEEEVHMITTIFQYPELVQREMERRIIPINPPAFFQKPFQVSFSVLSI